MSLPRLSRQDYVLIADTIARLDLHPDCDGVGLCDGFEEEDERRQDIAQQFAERLRGTNPAFDRDRFIAAATGQPLSRRDVQR